MNLKNIVYTVWRNLEGGDIPDDTRFNYGSIRTTIVGCVGDASLSLAFRLRNADADSPYPTYINDYESEVKFDPKGNLHYSEIQGRLLSFNGNRSIDLAPSENYLHRLSVDFVPTNSREWFLLKKLPKVPGVVYYMIESKRVAFLGDVAGMDSVRISQSFTIPTIGDESDDENTEIPDEIGRVVMGQALDILNGNLRSSDRANDGVPAN